MKEYSYRIITDTFDKSGVFFAKNIKGVIEKLRELQELHGANVIYKRGVSLVEK